MSRQSAIDAQALWPAPRLALDVTQEERASNEHRLSFYGLWLFTLLLYVRPNESFPDLFGNFPLVKIVAMATLLAYGLGKLMKGGRLSVWPPQLQLVALIWVLGGLSSVVALNPQESWDILFDPFFKVVCIFFLLSNLVNTRERLWAMWKLVVVCGSGIALGAINSYREGEFIKGDAERIAGVVKGIFGNPNDLATALNLLLPLALALAFSRRGIGRIFYLCCAAVLVAGIVVTFSRAGFLGLLALSGVLAWKVGRQRLAATILGVVMIVGVFLLAAPGSYTERLSTIFSTESDATGSAQERRELLKRAASVAIHHPALGVGMGNFHTYSIQEKVAHNAYLEIAAELGLGGLLAYVLLILLTVRSLRRVEREASPAAIHEPDEADERRFGTASSVEPKVRSGTMQECYLFSIVLQGSVAAYAVCSFFASIQYQWYLYYLVAYAVALEHIYASASGDEPAVSPHRQKTEIRELKYHVRTRFNGSPQPIEGQIQRSSVHGD